MRHHGVSLVLAVMLLAGSPALSANSDGGSSHEPLLVFAGAGFRSPVEEAARAFTEHTGIPVEATFAGSGCLLAQAELANRGDVFLPGELHYVRDAQERGLVGREV